MIKLFIYLPLHVLNAWLAYLSPRWVFKATYQPSSNTVRSQEQTMRNKTRLAAYHARKLMQ